MKKLLLTVMTMIFLISVGCKKKTCPAYQTDYKETYKMKGKRKKARMF